MPLPRARNTPTTNGTLIRSTASQQPDLSVTSADIGHSKTRSGSSDILNFRIRVRNLGSVDADGVRIDCVLHQGRAILAQQQFNRQSNRPLSIPANGTTFIQWQARASSSGPPLQLVVTVSGSGDSNAGNNRAILTIDSDRGSTPSSPRGTRELRKPLTRPRTIRN